VARETASMGDSPVSRTENNMKRIFDKTIF
jgi:hypothetical protein